MKITGTLSEELARRIDLSVLLPVTSELELCFLPKTLPSKLIKLSLKLMEKTTDSNFVVLPQTLTMVHYEAGKENQKAQILDELSKIKGLKTLDLWMPHSWEGLRKAVKLPTSNRFRWMTFYDKGIRWPRFEAGERYNKNTKKICS